MEIKKKVGIKYCGGCNPTYERVEIIQGVKSHFRDQLLFTRHEEKDIDVLIIVNGCSRACAAQNLNQAEVPRYSVTEENDFENLMVWLIVLEEKGEFY